MQIFPCITISLEVQVKTRIQGVCHFLFPEKFAFSDRHFGAIVTRSISSMFKICKHVMLFFHNLLVYHDLQNYLSHGMETAVTFPTMIFTERIF